MSHRPISSVLQTPPRQTRARGADGEADTFGVVRDDAGNPVAFNGTAQQLADLAGLGLAQPADTAGVGPTAAPSSSNPLGDLNADLKAISNALTGVQQTKDSTTSILTQFEQLIGAAPKPATPAPTTNPIMMVAIGALVLLGGLIVWRLVKKGG